MLNNIGGKVDKKAKEHRANMVLIYFMLIVATFPLVPESWYAISLNKPAGGGTEYVRFVAGNQLRHVTLSNLNVWMTSLPDSSLKLVDERTGKLIWTGTREQFLAAIVDTVVR